jgi:aldose 1-epimerase
VNSGGCVALEAQEWSDGINNPQWGRDKYQIIGPGETLEWDTTYRFGVVDV